MLVLQEPHLSWLNAWSGMLKDLSLALKIIDFDVLKGLPLALKGSAFDVSVSFFFAMSPWIFEVFINLCVFFTDSQKLVLVFVGF